MLCIGKPYPRNPERPYSSWSCHTFKAKQPRALLENIMATLHLELVHLDYLCLEPGRVQIEIILVVTDHFTQYAQAYVI